METPEKYKHDHDDFKYLIYTFAKSKFHVMEKLMNSDLVTLPMVQVIRW